MKFTLLAMLLLVPIAALAQDPVVVPGDIQVIGRTFLESIMEPVVTALSGLALALISWLSVVFTRKTGLVIEEKHRLALHSALMTGVSAAVKRAGEGASPKDIVADAIAYAKSSVPDAIDALKPAAATLSEIALSKLELLLLDALTIDPAPTPPTTAYPAAGPQKGLYR